MREWTKPCGLDSRRWDESEGGPKGACRGGGRRAATGLLRTGVRGGEADGVAPVEAELLHGHHAHGRVRAVEVGRRPAVVLLDGCQDLRPTRPRVEAQGATKR